jgi:hypothetical protein
MGYLGYLGRGAASPRWVSLKMEWIHRICEKEPKWPFLCGKTGKASILSKA